MQRQAVPTLRADKPLVGTVWNVLLPLTPVLLPWLNVAVPFSSGCFPYRYQS
ncbi:hypothetical protein [Klebsiella pneumoniae]|uniref:hypothetical protein n=1 Tax=Klebsiella pneumoniae TaxID=573 RepID=UPI001D0E9BB3|nr:hypothetical protein [Klebsiella pneumoniae]